MFSQKTRNSSKALWVEYQEILRFESHLAFVKVLPFFSDNEIKRAEIRLEQYLDGMLGFSFLSKM